MADKRFEYLALSHMWGTNHENQIRLTTKRFSEFEQGIPWGKLTPTFRQAVQITSVLGYRYIWIDSLCIIQASPSDSNSDWEHEAQRMALVYGNCVANIAFLFPHDEIRKTREDPRTWSSCILREASASQSGVYIRHLHESWHKSFLSREEAWLDQKQWPLFSRAWTFQEYLLSPRTLLYGHKNLMYQCSHVFYDELLGPIAEAKNKITDRTYTGRDLCKNRYFPPAISTIGNIDCLFAPALLSFTSDWMNTINEYRTRKLTYPTDRTIAFAGIATAYRKLSGMTYLAGLWWEHFPLSLLWFVEHKTSAAVRDENPERFPRGVIPVYDTDIDEQGVSEAPTWSWFSVPIYRFFRASFLFNDDERTVKGRSKREPRRCSFEDLDSAEPVSFYFGACPPNVFPKSGYSDFHNLAVVLNALVWPVSRGISTGIAPQLHRIRALENLGQLLQWDLGLTYYPDIPAIGEAPPPPRHTFFVLLVEFQIIRTGGLYHVERRLAGIVITRTERPGHWKRVGAWKLKIKIKGVEVNEGCVDDVAKRWKKYRLTSDWTKEQVTLF
ncbi:HET-domain-containing protein [Setomelanomma holmii]|uniref:HET-domain-containing protein n=1 Tax=Setomelanomma holmii TaxID=210430 RepID=A0A9P4GZT7_9PLEO|nr:HET-domain-containing protein [Setomelanomma holmii]